MFIKVEDIGPDGLEVSEDVGPDTVAGWLGDDGMYRPGGPAKVTLYAGRVGQGVLVKGRIDAPIAAECARCLKEIGLSASVPFTVLYTDRSGLGANAAREKLEEGEQYFNGPIIELDDGLRDELVLSLPMVARCSEECKGLCLDCGADLNDGPCGCHKGGSVLGEALRRRMGQGK